jgi:hypothetical protein
MAVTTHPKIEALIEGDDDREALLDVELIALARAPHGLAARATRSVRLAARSCRYSSRTTLGPARTRPIAGPMRREHAINAATNSLG